jgi:hypothetical protein
MTSAPVLRLLQSNQVALRAQVLRLAPNYCLWIAESEDEVYALNFVHLLAVDVYTPLPDGDSRVILLLKYDDDEIGSVDVGRFSPETAQVFMLWLQQQVLPTTMRAPSIRNSDVNRNTN